MAQVKTWLCPNCQRRVPEDVEVCRCGMFQSFAAAAFMARAQATPPTPAELVKQMGWDVKGLLLLAAVMVVAGIVTLFMPYEEPKLPALLGYAERPAPSPQPRR